MADKHIFIGLGGAGVNVVSLLKYKIYARTGATALKTRLQVLNDTYRFMFVDTDSGDVNKFNRLYQNMYEGGTLDFINEVELVNLGDMNPRFIRNTAAAASNRQLNRRIIEACPDVVAESMDDKQLVNGAGALRLKSRIAFASKESDFTGKFLSNIQALNQVGDNGEQNVLHYWVVASCNGGTGSGTMHDVLYLVNMIHRSRINNADPKVGLILFMPRYYIDANKTNPRYPRNAYAVFSELNALQGWARDKARSKTFHRLAMIDHYNLFDDKTSYRPFSFCIPVDYHTADNNNMGSQEKMYSNTAELLYYIHAGSGGAGFDSFVNNYEDGEKLWPEDCYLIPMGYRAIRKPNDEFENYMSIRLRYEMLRYGILGEGIEGASERKDAAAALFDSVIRPMLFAGGDSESFFTKAAARAAEKLEEEMSDTIIRDSKGKIVSKLPPTVGIGTTESIIADIKAMFDKMDSDKKRTRQRLEAMLWQWTEDNARKWGLRHVLDILQETDALCTDMYQSYTTDTRPEHLLGISTSRQSLVANRDGIKEELADLQNKALTISISEAFGGNRGDVQQFFSRLRDWADASIDVELAEASFKLMNELCYGDQGILDQIIAHVRNLIAQGTVALEGDKGAAAAYKGLARTFLEKNLDVTSVYIPDITCYADGHGWVEQGNRFAGWYNLIIGKSGRFVEYEGFAPLRNGDSVLSLEAFISRMITDHKEQMIQEGYWVIEGETGHSQLFTNRTKSDYLKVIEDMLGYAASTMRQRLLENQEVSQQWYRKTLSQLISELNNEKRLDIQRKSNPTLFFPYQRVEAHQLTSRSFCVGPTADTQALFLNDGDTRYLPSNEPDEMYKISTLLGMSLRCYDMYGSIKAEYEKCQNKEFYHFHKVFAEAGGIPERIRLPREIRPEVLVFAKYLLADRLKSETGSLMWKSDNAYDADHFAKTPVILSAKLVKFATMRSISLVDDEKIALRKSDGVDEFYIAKAIDKQDQRYTQMLEGFIEEYTTGQFDKLINEYVRLVKYLSPDLLARHYADALAALKTTLNDKFKDAGRKEKQTLTDILTVLDTRLNSVDKFIASNLWA